MVVQRQQSHQQEDFGEKHNGWSSSFTWSPVLFWSESGDKRFLLQSALTSEWMTKIAERCALSFFRFLSFCLYLLFVEANFHSFLLPKYSLSPRNLLCEFRSFLLSKFWVFVTYLVKKLRQQKNLFSSEELRQMSNDFFSFVILKFTFTFFFLIYKRNLNDFAQNKPQFGMKLEKSWRSLRSIFVKRRAWRCFL